MLLQPVYLAILRQQETVYIFLKECLSAMHCNGISLSLAFYPNEPITPRWRMLQIQEIKKQFANPFHFS